MNQALKIVFYQLTCKLIDRKTATNKSTVLSQNVDFASISEMVPTYCPHSTASIDFIIERVKGFSTCNLRRHVS